MTQRALYHASLYDPAPVPSWWEASAPPPQAGFGPLQGDREAEVAIVGGGFTGLSCALHLAKEHGIQATVLDAGHIGWGASGRNGGFVCWPAMKMGLSDLVSRWGEEEARQFLLSQIEAVELVDALGRDEAIDYDRQGEGFYSVAHRPEAFAHEQETGEALRRLVGADTKLLSKEAFAEVGHRGTEQFGALLLKPGFGLHPLKFLSGLAAAAARRGATLHGHSAVTEIRKEGDRHLLITPQGTLRARRLVLATNGFLKEGLHPGLDARVLPALSNVVVTRPLTEAERAAENFVAEEPISNTRHLLFYYRLLPDKRLLFGARGDTSGDPAVAAKMRVWLERRLGEVWPAFAGAETTHFWRGLVSLTRRLTPAVGRLPEDGSVFFAYGCHGNGVNTMPWAGRAIAKLIRGANRDEDVIPTVARGPAPRFPFPALRRWALKGAYLYYQLKDR